MKEKNKVKIVKERKKVSWKRINEENKLNQVFGKVIQERKTDKG